MDSLLVLLFGLACLVIVWRLVAPGSIASQGENEFKVERTKTTSGTMWVIGFLCAAIVIALIGYGCLALCAEDQAIRETMQVPQGLAAQHVGERGLSAVGRAREAAADRAVEREQGRRPLAFPIARAQNPPRHMSRGDQARRLPSCRLRASQTDPL